MGVAVFHYANWVEHWVARRYYLDWTGGLWVQGGSRNPVDQWTMTPKTPDHPILRGVKEWTYRDEVFCRFFLPTDREADRAVIGTPGRRRRRRARPQLASWAYERDGGGRGFVMGGVDFHDNLATVDDYRRFLLNGIVWAAGMEVPAGGVQSTVAGGGVRVRSRRIRSQCRETAAIGGGNRILEATSAILSPDHAQQRHTRNAVDPEPRTAASPFSRPSPSRPSRCRSSS